MSRESEQMEWPAAVIRTPCPYCGYKTLDDEASFCSRCGKPLHTAALLVRRRERAEWLEHIQEIGTSPDAGRQPDAGELLHRMRADEREDRAEQEDEGPSLSMPLHGERHGGKGERPRRRMLPAYAKSVMVDVKGATLTPEERARRRRLWLLPALALLLGGASALGVLWYDSSVNHRVAEWQKRAEREALAGRYPQAEQLLLQATKSRPDSPGLLRDLDIVEQANRLDDQVKDAARLLESGRLKQAEGVLRQAQAAVANRQERVFDPVRSRIAAEGARLLVKQVYLELEGLNTVPELADRLQRLRGLQDAGAVQLRQRILDLMVETGVKKADELLRTRDYSAAQAVVNEALEHAGAVEELKDMSSRITSEREEYERLEQERLDAAREIAYDEQLRNHTAAVALRNIEVSRDNSGKVLVSGEVESKATRGIHSVQLDYKLIDEEGRTVGSGTARTESGMTIEPGGKAKFQGISSMSGVEVTAVITKATWYVE
ncbi:FxLYD domain-containing protein [Paenibacillus herberti]|uniref:Zinc-ribbon domain-containing protein n=1 Tax=Paenibacillus herberti TaxID=1619309 RepID=A0A229NVT1_9BACL|nr:FxLYD domain-containing protein [Paenibacillus herberti]OXM14043.1 hypothetical protein CGZ75_13700 [Paenibacillus herberti]